MKRRNVLKSILACLTFPFIGKGNIPRYCPPVRHWLTCLDKPEWKNWTAVYAPGTNEEAMRIWRRVTDKIKFKPPA